MNPTTNCITVTFTYLHPETHNSERIDSVRYLRPEDMDIETFTQYVQKESDKQMVNHRDNLSHQRYHVFMEDSTYSFTTPQQQQIFVAPSQRLSVPSDQILIMTDYAYELVPTTDMSNYTQLL